MTDIGIHLLGRVPSEPDDRNWQLKTFIEKANPTPLDIALDALLASRASKATKVWAQIATQIIEGKNPTPVPPQPTPVQSGEVVWTDAHQLDQGNYGTCVGNGWAQWGNTLPIDDNFSEKDARAIYYEATVIDGQPDNPDAPGGGQQGSSVHSGAKAMLNRKRISAYAWAANVDEICQWLLIKGPVTVGTDWMNDMFNPDANGFVKPTGKLAGGHCFLALGYNPETQAIKFQNSWGTSWGQNGYFFMSKSDFIKLFSNQGEACTGVELP